MTCQFCITLSNLGTLDRLQSGPLADVVGMKGSDTIGDVKGGMNHRLLGIGYDAIVQVVFLVVDVSKPLPIAPQAPRQP